MQQRKSDLHRLVQKSSMTPGRPSSPTALATDHKMLNKSDDGAQPDSGRVLVEAIQRVSNSFEKDIKLKKSQESRRTAKDLDES